TRDFKEAVNILVPFQNKNEESLMVYQRVPYFRGLEFYNERAFEISISMFMRCQSNPIDAEITALFSYWLAEAKVEVRIYGESVSQYEKFLAMSAAKKTDVYNYANYALGYSAFQNESYSKASNYFQRFLSGNDKDQNTIVDATLR